MKQHNGFRAAAGLLVAGSLALSACTQLDTPPKYAKGVKVDCGGKQDITGSGSTAQANAMSHFITSYEESCSGKQLDLHGQRVRSRHPGLSRRQDRFRRLGLTAER